MTSVLQRPKHPLPRRLARRVSPATLSFVKRRHKRAPGRTRERFKKIGRRAENMTRELAGRLRKWGLYVLGGIIVLAIGILLFSPILEVREIRIQRTEPRVDVPRIQRALAPVFGRHLLFLSTFEVSSRIRDAVPDVDKVSISKQFPSLLSVRVDLRPLIARLDLQQPPGSRTATGSVSPPRLLPGSVIGTGALAVPAAPPEPDEGPRYDYLIDNGFYISTRTASSGTVLPVINIADWSVRPVPNTLLVTSEFLKQMRDAEAALTQQFGLKISVRTIYLRAQEFHLGTGKLSFWFDVRGSLEEQLGRFRIFLKAVKLTDVRQYIDLRIAGRVIYR